MNLAWKRLDAEASAVELDAEASPDERIAAPLSESARPWILWLGEDDAAAERAARRFLKAVHETLL